MADIDLQEDADPRRANLRIPKLARSRPPQGDRAALAEAAKLLVEREEPGDHRRPHARATRTA